MSTGRDLCLHFKMEKESSKTEIGIAPPQKSCVFFEYSWGFWECSTEVVCVHRQSSSTFVPMTARRLGNTGTYWKSPLCVSETTAGLTARDCTGKLVIGSVMDSKTMKTNYRWPFKPWSGTARRSRTPATTASSPTCRQNQKMSYFNRMIFEDFVKVFEDVRLMHPNWT